MERTVTRRARILVGLTAGILAAAVRLYGIGSILTVDEPQWIFRSQSFSRALARGDPGGTFQGTHPGVVPMLLIGGGIRAAEWLWQAPLVSPTVGRFRAPAKISIALGVSAGIALAAALAASLWGARAGLAAGLLLALEPSFLGHAQLAHVDALLAILMVLALLAMLLYERTMGTRHAMLSGFLGGLALLTKLPGATLFPIVAFLAVTRGSSLRVAARDVLRWSAVSVGTFLLLWPSMWLNVLPNVRYLARDVAAVAETRETEPVEGASTPAFYIRALLRRTSPATFFLAIGGIALLLRAGPRLRRDGLALATAAIGFAAALSAVGKHADRYLLPSIALLAVLAAPALASLMGGGPGRRGARWARVLAQSAIGSMALNALLLQPYAIAYISPLAPAEDLTQSGWGEGLERAAALLNTHPLASDLRVASWYPVVVREFFNGETMSLSSRQDPRVTHVVLYRNMWGRPPLSPATAVLEEYRGKKPLAAISVLGREVAWIYETDSVRLFPEHVGELVAPAGAPRAETVVATEAGQIVPVSRDGWSGVRIAFATFSSRPTSATVIVHVRAHPDGPDLRTVTIDAASIVDGEWREARFAPLLDSRGKTYYVALTSPDGLSGNAVTVRYQPRGSFPGSAILIRRPVRAGERRADFSRGGDLALKLLYEK